MTANLRVAGEKEQTISMIVNRFSSLLPAPQLETLQQKLFAMSDREFNDLVETIGELGLICSGDSSCLIYDCLESELHLFDAAHDSMEDDDDRRQKESIEKWEERRLDDAMSRYKSSLSREELLSTERLEASLSHEQMHERRRYIADVMDRRARVVDRSSALAVFSESSTFETH